MRTLGAAHNVTLKTQVPPWEFALVNHFMYLDFLVNDPGTVEPLQTDILQDRLKCWSCRSVRHIQALEDIDILLIELNVHVWWSDML